MTNLFLLSLILSLGHSSYPEREQSTVTLRGLSPVEYLAWGEGHKDAEIAARCRKLMEEYHWQLAGELMPTNYPYRPWADSLPEEYPARAETINNYLAMVGACPSHDVPVWTKYRKATKFFIYHKLRNGESKIEIIRFLDGMAAWEKGWINKHKGSYKFSAELLKAAGK